MNIIKFLFSLLLACATLSIAQAKCVFPSVFYEDVAVKASSPVLIGKIIKNRRNVLVVQEHYTKTNYNVRIKKASAFTLYGGDVEPWKLSVGIDVAVWNDSCNRTRNIDASVILINSLDPQDKPAKDFYLYKGNW